MKAIGHLIGGEYGAHGDERFMPVINPATAEMIGEVVLGSQQSVSSAINAAKEAFVSWRNTPANKRAQILFKLKSLLEEHSDELCELICDEHGKVKSDAKGELTRGIENVEFACGIPQLLKGEYSKNVGPSIDSWSDVSAVGVVAGITPFNFPAMVPLWMWPLAVACGNTFILKPSEKAPSVALRIAQLAHEAGLPKGVLNVVNGDRIACEELIKSPDIKAISFVGSTPVAQKIYEEGCKTGKRVQALGGAKNHAVVMPDADIDNSVSAIMGAAYGSCGERCMALSVVVAVGDDTADTLIDKLSQQIRELRVGPASAGNMDMGPLISKEHLEKVKSYVDRGVQEGATLVVDGRKLKVTGHENGFFLGPCLFDNVKGEMSIYKDEIFGPVLCLLRAKDLEEALNLINAHEFGNGTCIFTRDGEAARYFADQVEVGMVGINVPLPVPVSYHSFGGWKRSLFGSHGAYGPDGIRFYTKRKTITQRWIQGSIRENASYSFPS